MTDREAVEKIAFGHYSAAAAKEIARQAVLGDIEPGHHGIPARGETDNAKIFTPENIARVHAVIEDLRRDLLEQAALRLARVVLEAR